jgi:PAS domain S-box-containing protein
MLRLDVGTLAFSAAVASLAAALVMAACAVSRRQDRYWHAYALSAAFYGFGTLPIILIGPSSPASLTHGIGLLVQMSALAFHAGACRLTGRPLPLAAYCAVLAISGASLVLVHGTDADINTRIALSALLRAPVFLHAALLIHRGVARRTHTCAVTGLRLLEAVALGWVVLLSLRGGSAALVETPMHDLMSQVGAPAFYFLAAGLSHILVVIGLLRLDTDAIATRYESTVAENLTRSEADLRAILDNMTDIFYRTDAQGRILMLSHSVETVLGYPVDELLGRLAADIYANSHDRIALLDAMEAKGGSVTDYELQMRHKNGIALWLSISCRMRLDDTGQRVGTEGVLRLIEERKRAEVNIQESRSMIRALLDASADAIMLIEPDGKILAVNGVTAGRFGHTADELSGTSLWDLFPPEVSAARRKACQAVLDSGEPVHTLDRRGDRYLDNSIFPVTGRNDAVVRLAIYSRDITVQKLAETKIAAYVAEMERSNAELEQFAYVASHDLREPLRMITSYLQLIEQRYSSQLDDEAKEFIAFAVGGATRMKQLITDLLTYSRVQTNRENFKPVDLNILVGNVLQNLKSMIADTEAQVDVDPLPTILGNGALLLQLFQNLINNAIKFRSAQPPCIELRVERAGPMWQFSVRDNGIGFDPRYANRIFVLFQRLHSQAKYSGTGIGLTICKKVVESHAGEIWVESEPGVGSTFFFTLPAIQEGDTPHA